MSNSKESELHRNNSNSQLSTNYSQINYASNSGTNIKQGQTYKKKNFKGKYKKKDLISISNNDLNLNEIEIETKISVNDIESSNKIIDENPDFIPFDDNKSDNDKKVKIDCISWMNENIKKSYGYSKLHNEILSFYNFIKPTKEEDELRNKTYNIIRCAIISKFPLFEVSLYGSFPLNIHLPDSDIDIVVLTNNENMFSDETLFNEIKSSIYNRNISKSIKKIDAKVPILKVLVEETGIEVDISINKSDGYKSLNDISNILTNLKSLSILIYVVKYFLKQRELSETYSGGVCSFLLFHLCYAFINYHIKTSINHIEENNHEFCYGKLLLSFFEFYSFKFKFDSFGISIKNGVNFFRRKELPDKKKSLLCVENFLDSTKDIGKLAYNFSTVIESFKKARDNLKFPAFVKYSLLDKVIFVDEYLINRMNSKKLLNIK